MMRVRSAGTIIFMVFILLSSPTRAAIGANITCMSEYLINDTKWEDPLVRRLRDQGLKRPEQPFCTVAMLTGVIEIGDSIIIEKFIQKNIPFFSSLLLNSIGGDLVESLAIGRVAKKYYIATEAPSEWEGKRPFYLGGGYKEVPNAICASACFFVWLGGVNRTGELLGIHRPFPPVSDMQKLSPAEAQEFYRGLSEKIIAYLAEMDAAPHWLNDMMKISSDEIYMIPYDQIRSELQGDARAYFDLPSFAQWKTAKCDALSVQEFGDLWSITNQNPIPERLNGYYAYLKRRNTEIMTCGYQAVIMARWQLRDPGRGN